MTWQAVVWGVRAEKTRKGSETKPSSLFVSPLTLPFGFLLILPFPNSLSLNFTHHSYDSAEITARLTDTCVLHVNSTLFLFGLSSFA